MSDNEFTESMEVEAVGNLKPGDIGWGTCDGCEKNIHKFPGVLLQGVTQEAAKLLYEKVEIVAEGTKAKMEELEACNVELLEALEYLLGQCEENERNNTNFMGISNFARTQATKAIQKARGNEK